MGRLGKTTAEYLAEVEENGLALRYVPLSRRTRTICLAAVRSNGLVLQYVPANMRSDIVLCLDAVDSAGMALEFVPESLRGRELCFDAMPCTATDAPCSLCLRNCGTMTCAPRRLKTVPGLCGMSLCRCGSLWLRQAGRNMAWPDFFLSAETEKI